MFGIEQEDEALDLFKGYSEDYQKTARSIISKWRSDKKGLSVDDLADQYGGATDELKSFLDQADRTRSVDDLMTDFGKTLGNTGKQAQTFGERITSGFKTFGRAAVATLGNVGLDLLIGTGIQLAANAWQNYANRQEKALDEADAAIADHEKSAASLASATSMVESSGERFVELQKGINTATGENKSLTEAEYQEYTTMANSLAETLPGLSNGYNAIGNAKIKAVGSIEDLNAALREQQKVVNNETIQNAHKYAKAYDALTDHEAVTMVDEAGYKQQERALRNLISAYEDGQLELALMDQNMITANTGISPQDGNSLTAKMLSSMDRNALKQISEELGVDAVGLFGRIDYKEIEDNIDLYRDYLGELDSMQQEAFETYNKPMLSAFAENSNDYEELSDNAKELMSTYIDSLDYETNAAKFLDENGEASVDKMKSWSQALTRDLRKEGVSEALDDLVNLDPDDMTLDEYKNKFSDLSDFITDRVDGMSEHNLKEMTGYEDMLDQMEADYTNAYDAIGKEADKLTTKQLGDLNILMSDKPYLEIDSYEDAMSVLNDYYEQQAVSFENMQTALANATAGQASINTALQNSISSTGLLTDDLTNLQAAFSEVAGYDTDALFEQTASGLRLNRDALSAYQAEQEKNIKSDFEAAILQQNKALEEQRQILESTASTQQEKDLAQSNIAGIQSQIEQLELMRAQYNGLTSDYSKWVNALSNGEEGDIYDTVATNWQAAKQAAEDGWIGTDEFKRAVDYMYSGSLDNQTPQEVKAVYDELNGLVSGWYQFDDDGNLLGMQSLKQFVSDAETLDDVLGKDVQTSFEQLEDGTYKATLNAQEFADAWGVSEEVITDLAGKMRDAGWDVEVTGVTSDFALMAETAEEAQEIVSNITGQTYEFDFKTTSLEKAREQLQQAEEQLSHFRNEDGSYNMDAEGASEAAQVYEYSARKEQELSKPSISSVDSSSVAQSSQEFVEAAQNFQTAKDELDVQTQLAAQGLPNNLEQATADAQDSLSVLQDLQKAGKVPFDIDTSGLQEAEDGLQGLSDEEIKAKIGADTSQAQSDIQSLEGSSVTIHADVSTEGGAQDLASDFAALPEGIATTITVDVQGEEQVENLTTAMESAPDNTPVTIKCNVENAEQLATINEQAAKLNEAGKEIKIEATVGKLNTDEVSTEGQTVDLKGSVKEIIVEEGQNLTVDLKGNVTEVIGAEGQNLKVDVEGNVTTVTGAEGQNLKVDVQGNVETVTGSEGQQLKVEVIGDVTDVNPPSEGSLNVDLIGDVTDVNPPEEGNLHVDLIGDVTDVNPPEENGLNVDLTGNVTTVNEVEDAALSVDLTGNVTTINETAESGLSVDVKANATLETVTGGEEKVVNVKAKATVDDVTGADGKIVNVKAKAEVDQVTGAEGKTVNVKADATIDNITGAEGKDVNVNATANITNVTGANGQQVVVDATANVTNVNTSTGNVVVDGTVNWNNLQPPQPSPVTATGTINWTNLTPVTAPIIVSGTINWGNVTPPVINDITAAVNYQINAPTPPVYPDQHPSVIYSLSAPAPPSYPNISRTITYTIQTVGSPPAANGTAHAQGTIPKLSARNLVAGSLEEDARHRTAMASGDWTTKKTETALVGELGQELVVDTRANRWYTVGDRGAQFANIPAGSIVFNHKQTEEIFKNGYVTSGGGRGKIAHANGTALASGTAYAEGSDVKSKWENFIDWIEKRVEKLTHNIEIYTARSEIWKSYTSQNHSINSAMRETQKLLDFQNKASDEYRKKANEVGLSKDLQNKVINGTINMNEYDEATRQQIEDFEEMIEKVREADLAVYELRKELKELAQQKLDNIVDRFEAFRGVHTSSIDVIDEKLNYLDAAGKTYTNSPTYRDLITDKSSELRKTIAQIEKERTAYAKELKKAAKTWGETSTEYYEAEAQLNEIVQELYEAKAELEENEQLRKFGFDQQLQEYQVAWEERALDRLDRSQALREAMNQLLDHDDYRAQIDTLNEAYARYEKQKQLYKDEMVTLAVYSERYQELAEKVNDVEESQADLVLRMEEFADLMRELDWKPFNDQMDAYNKAIDALEHMRSLLNENNFVAIDADITADGYANLMLIAKAMETNKQIVADYKEGIANITEELNNGRISEEEYKKYLDEYTKGIYDATLANEEYKDSILEMYQAQLEAENELLQDNIDKRKEAQKAKQDYYEWDRNIRDKNKDIIALQAQVAALEGTSNAAGQAKLAQLRAELAEKQQDLDDDIMDRQFDQISNGLDKVSEDADNVLESSLDALERNADYQEAVIKNMLDKTVNMYQSAYGQVNNIIAQTGTYIESTLKDALIGVGGLMGQDWLDQVVNNAQSPTVGPSDAATGVNTDKDETVNSSNAGSVNDMIDKDTQDKAETDSINNVKKITVTPSNKTITVGSTVQLKANISSEKNSPQTSAVTWTSSNPSVATVNSKGLVTGVHYGTATITCTSADANWRKKSGTATIKVITKTEGILYDNKGESNTGTSALNEWFGSLGYGKLTRTEAATIAKEHGLNYDADELMVKGSYQKEQNIINAMKGPMLKKVIKAMKDETRSAAELKEDASVLGKYISDTYDKEMTASDAVRIAKILQMDVPSKFSDWSYANKNAVKKELSKYKISFSKGGYVGKGNYIPLTKISNDEFVRSLARKGDSGIIGINPGEVILTKEKADALLNTIMPVSEALADTVRNANYSNVINKQPVQEITLQYGSLLTVNGSVDRDALPGLQTILEKSYKYTSQQLKYELRKNGTK